MRNPIALTTISLALLSLSSCQSTGYPGPDVETAARVTVTFKS